MNVIKSAIKCDECSNVLRKPVILSCGSIVCYKHLEDLNNNTYSCKSCQNDHHIEENHKTINRRIETLIQANLEKLNFGSEYKTAYDEWNTLDQTINDFETLQKDPPHFIKQIIDKLKNKTELIREEYKIKIDEKATQIITQLDNYQTECVNNLDSLDYKEKISTINENIAKLKTDLDEWENKLNDFNSSKNEWTSIQKNCNEQHLNLKQQTLDLKTQLLKQKLDHNLKLVSDFQEVKLNSDIKLDKKMREYEDILKDIEIKNIDIKNIQNSKVIDEAKRQQLLTLCNISSYKRWKFIYRGSEHGLNAESFHSKCDNIPNTLTIIKSTCGYIFGGFTSQTWESNPGVYKNDSSAYLFSLVNPQNHPQKLMSQNASNGIHCNSGYGPRFGNVSELGLYINYSSNGSNLGSVYPTRNGNQPYLTESQQFTISDIDIYQIV